MSQPGSVKLTGPQAYNLLLAYLNDGGEAGADAALGGGMPDLGRALNGKTRGLRDAAVASQRVLPPTRGFPNGQLEVLVQNRGTETLINTGVRISTPSGVVTSNITSLAANAVSTVRVPIPRIQDSDMRYETVVNLSNGRPDAKPSNDRRAETYVPARGK